jgi:hypothetical protein
MPPRDPGSVPNPARMKKLGTLVLPLLNRLFPPVDGVPALGAIAVLSVFGAAFATAATTAMAATDGPEVCLALVIVGLLVIALILIRRRR